MRLCITNPMLEIRNRKTLQSKVNICKSDVKIGDYADSLVSMSHLYVSVVIIERSGIILKYFLNHSDQMGTGQMVNC